MRIVIQPSNILSESKSKFIQVCVTWTAQHLLTHGLIDKVNTIKVQYMKRIKNAGTCYETYLPSKDKYNFTLQLLDEESYNTISQTIAHEFIHLKQTLTGELGYDTTCNCWIWRGKNYGTDPYKNTDDHRQLLKWAPWEKEAYEREEKIANLFWTDLQKLVDTLT